MRNVLLGMCIVALGIVKSASATSARNIHPQLVGIEEVWLNLSAQTVPGLDAQALERQVRDRLTAAGIKINDTAPVVLFIQIRYEPIGGCPGNVLIHTLVAVSEEVQLDRRNRSDPLTVNTYEDGEHFIAPRDDAAERSAAATLRALDYLLSSREYTSWLLSRQQ